MLIVEHVCDDIKHAYSAEFDISDLVVVIVGITISHCFF